MNNCDFKNKQHYHNYGLWLIHLPTFLEPATSCALDSFNKDIFLGNRELDSTKELAS